MPTQPKQAIMKEKDSSKRVSFATRVTDKDHVSVMDIGWEGSHVRLRTYRISLNILVIVMIRHTLEQELHRMSVHPHPGHRHVCI